MTKVVNYNADKSRVRADRLINDDSSAKSQGTSNEPRYSSRLTSRSRDASNAAYSTLITRRCQVINVASFRPADARDSRSYYNLARGVSVYVCACVCV